MIPTLSERQFRMAVILAVVLAGGVAYVNTFDNEFVWDDVSSVLIHRHVQDPAQFLQLFQEDQHAFGRGQGNFYRPLVAASFMADFALSHGRPEGEPETWGIPDVSPMLFHATNLFWHLLTAILVLALLNRLDAPRFVQAAAPLLYVVHPLHTQAVTYISGRADPMAAAFMMAALVVAAPKRYKETEAGHEAHDASFDWGSGGWYLLRVTLCGAFTVAAVLCKESATILPALLLVLALLPPDGGDRRWLRWRALIPVAVSAVVVGVYGALRMTVLRFGEMVEGPVAPFTQRLTETFQAFALYIRLIFAPVGLHMERSLDGVPTAIAGTGFLFFAAIVAGVIVLYRRGEWRASLGLTWFLVTWFPISGIIPLNAPMAEHWLYVPLFGFVWAFVEVLHTRVSKRIPWHMFDKATQDAVRKSQAPAQHWPRYVAHAAVFAVGLVFMALTLARNQDWRDNETLYRATLAKNPNSIRVHFNLAVTYEDLLDNMPGARRHYEQVLALYREQKTERFDSLEHAPIYDDELEAHLSLGRIHKDDGQHHLAIDHFMTLLGIEPQGHYAVMAAEAAYGIGRCLLSMGRLEHAMGYFDYAMSLAPGLQPEIDAELIDVLPAYHAPAQREASEP